MNPGWWTAGGPVTEPRGARVERLAEAHLTGEGLTLQHRNYRCKQGEIDLIMTQGETLVFVEVRFRKSARFGSAAESVTRSKQQRLLLAARDYLLRHPRDQRRPARFDVVAVTLGAQGGYEYQWLQGAFGDCYG